MNAHAITTRSDPYAEGDPLRILIVDDHPVTRGGLRAALSTSSQVQVVGPDEQALSPSNEGSGNRALSLFTPELVGRYRIRGSDADGERIVAFDPNELRAVPHPPEAAAALPNRRGSERNLDVSPELVHAVLALMGLEVLLRLFRVWRRRSHDLGSKSPQSSKISAQSRA